MDKIVDLDPWNFDGENVKQCAKLGKKKKTEGWLWEAPTYNKSTVIEDYPFIIEKSRIA